jgi:hypothetical protein
MTNRLMSSLAREPKPLRGAQAVPIQGSYGFLTHLNGQHLDVHDLFQQLAHSLAVLSGASELVVEGKGTQPSGQALRVWLQPHARQAEGAMHQLRDLRLTHSSAVTELSQSLTVLVLAADMLAQGQLSGPDAMSFYDLLRRNADSAMRSFAELRARLDPEPYV